MGIIKTLRGWKKDRVEVSMEPHEIAYIKSVALGYLKDTKTLEDHKKFPIRVSTLRKLCKYIEKR